MKRAWPCITLVVILGGLLVTCVVVSNAAIEDSSFISEYETLLEKYGVDTLNRKSHFLAQIAHETWGFLLLTEFISDEKAEKLYGVGTAVGKTLGNLEIGDGAKYKGRGWIMLTGRFNYQQYGDLIDVDLINHPELAALSSNAWLIAALFWEKNGLNELADANDIAEITLKVSGSLDSLEERKYWLKKFELKNK